MKVNRITRQIITIVLSIAALLYIALQIRLSVGDMLEIESAYYTNIKQTINTDAFFFRDESVIETTAAGTCCYLLDNGEKAGKNQTVAMLYSNQADADVQDKINEYEKKIALLEKSHMSNKYQLSDVDRLNESISEMVMQLIDSVNSNNLQSFAMNEDELLIKMNMRLAASQQVSTFNIQIDSYKSEIEKLKANLKGTPQSISTSESGYIYRETDGYEKIFTMDALNGMTLESYNSLKTAVPDVSLMSSSVAKVVKSSKWYIAVQMDKKEASRLIDKENLSKSYEIQFPYSGNISVGMQYHNEISQTDNDNVVVIFVSSSVIAGFNYTRSQPVRIVKNEYTGLKIPTSAVRSLDNVTGVYSLDGKVVIFKETTILYEENGYYICKFPIRKDTNGKDTVTEITYVSQKELSLYDPVIISGRDLYVGKIVS